MSGLEVSPFIWAIPVAMAYFTYDHRHPFAKHTFKVETDSNSMDTLIVRAFQCGSSLDYVPEDSAEYRQDNHELDYETYLAELRD